MGSLGNSTRTTVDSVAVIGAGPSGLAVAKYLLAEKVFSNVAIFEQRSHVGGIWNHVAGNGSLPVQLKVPQTDPHGGLDKPIVTQTAGNLDTESRTETTTFATPIYDDLETNIPRGLMGFSDLDWPTDCQLFPGYEQVLKYIERYSEGLQHLIQFQTQVVDVRHAGSGRWKVSTKRVSASGDQPIKEHNFGAVVVANGHFNVPYVPQVAGLREWNEAYPGSISHSKFYCTPEHYADKKVIIVGNSASGIDIGIKIRETCRKPLIQSSKSESYLQPDHSADQMEKPEIVRFSVQDRTVVFADGTRETGVHSILYCTGYFYDFPFLESLDPPLVSSGERVENLYQHIFYRPLPTLAFPVLNQKVIPFPVAESQGAVIARVFSGRLTLPSQEIMREWEQKTLLESGGGRNFHVMKFPKDADYINMLHDWAASANVQEADAVSSDPSEGPAELKRMISAGWPREVGKEPPYWGPKACWTRERFPAIKKKFQSLGEQRHSRLTLEDIGFSFEDWKKEQDKHSRH